MMQTRHRLVLVDDHSVIRDLFKFQLCRSEPLRYEVVGEGSTGQEGVDICLQTRPDVLLLDLILPGPQRGRGAPPAPTEAAADAHAVFLGVDAHAADLGGV